jgi:plasmid stabilization system protein ParE
MAVREVVWATPAREDLRAIRAYVGADSPAYARALIRRILEATRNLALFPNLGRVAYRTRAGELRVLTVYSYHVYYKVAEDRVSVAAIVHGAQLQRRALAQRGLTDLLE